MKTTIFKHLLATAMLLLVSTSLWSADGDTFTANTAEGVSMTFKIISESEKTCQVGDENSTPAIATSYAGVITIPETANGYSVTAIGKDAFHFCSSITSVSIPSSVTTIGYDAFSECTSLTSVNIPSSVTKIETYAFHLCSRLKSVTLNEGLLVIMDNAFKDCTSLTEITIPSSVEMLSFHAFLSCSGLTSVTLLGKPNQHFSNIAFQGCDNLTTFRCDGITLEPVDGVYQIGTAEELRDFAILTTAANCKLNACLTSDIDYTVYVNGDKWINMGMNGYAGTFDGQGHTITLNYYNIGRSWNIESGALFNKVVGGTVKNLRVAGRIENDAKYSAGIAAEICNATISHCVIDVDFVSQIDGDCTDGGIVARTYNGPEESTIEYCVVAGSFQGAKANCRGGLVGWIQDSSHVNFSNCLFVADVDGLDMTDSNTWGRNMDGRATVTNCYYLNALGDVSEGTQVTATQLTDGELCYLLNGDQSSINWTQNLTGATIDSYPLPFSTHAQVYANGNNYSNVEEKNYLSMADTKGFVGEKAIIKVELTNKDVITAMQFELSLPEGVSVASATLTDRKDGHTIDYTLQANGNYQFTVFSSSSKAINGNEGDVANISLSISSSIAAGSYTILVKNIELTTTSAIAILQPDLSATLIVSNIKLGDVNGDDKMSITDAVGIVNYILGNASSNFHPEAADVNGDNRVSITDAVALVNIILNQSATIKERRTQEIVTEREPQ